MIERLPQIVVAGRQEAEEVLARVSASRGASLQIDEVVVPALGCGVLGGKGEGEGLPWYNRLLYGDNLIIIEALLAGDPPTGLPSLRGKVDLIYIDPPFATNAGYRVCRTLPGFGEGKPFLLEMRAYSDCWEDGLAGYLRMLCPRLFLMRELLSENGSLIIHLDWHAVHYVKVMLDEIFGQENFRNEIAWCYGGGGAPRRTYPKKHDLILWYTKGSNWTFNRQYRPYTKGTLERGLTAVKGNKYELRAQGAGLDDWWAGSEVQKILSPTAVENLKFSTQKPEGLLKRIIVGHSNEGDLVADFFSGTGTTAAVAGRLGRRWIAVDISKQALMISYKRLVAEESGPFICQSVRNHSGAFLQKASVRGAGEKDLVLLVLNIFGAVPFPGWHHSEDALGYLENGESLVLVASPSRRIDRLFLKKACELKKSLPGEWEKIVVLGWGLDDEALDFLEEHKRETLEVLIIAPELLNEGRFCPKERNLLQRRGLYFLPPARLTLKEPFVKRYSHDHEEIIIELDDYRLLASDYLPVSGEAEEKVRRLLEKDPLALIEYWSVDPDYDGNYFCSRWQNWRKGKERRIRSEARLIVPRVEGIRRIGVKAVDVFGYESRAYSLVCSSEQKIT
ncbi:DNA methyltransferase [Thermacetogenium phaeum]|uniref:DNA methyltransferase n=1 Tax=Thermacetogenium phaeum TaxID=85874 RepID=UPI00130E3A2F|nr:DNA methyltransferase [Thermacetogenium phaeum]